MKKYTKYCKYESTLNLIPQHHGDKETLMYMYDASFRFWCNTRYKKGQYCCLRSGMRRRQNIEQKYGDEK